jgi:uncharacterized HAD superfamily protein
MKNTNNKLIAVDIDGTLTTNDCWTEDDCLYAEPKKDIIEKVNKLYYQMNHIIVYTARREELRGATEYWLRKNGVKYHAIVMGYNKMGADIYVDDRAIRPEEL